jgi:hypothetical protein
MLIANAQSGSTRSESSAVIDDNASPAEMFGERAERDAADDGVDIVDDRDEADLMRREAVLDFKERRVKVLGAVAEEVESGHEQDRVDAETPMRL